MSILLRTYTAENAENDSIATLSKKQQTITRSYQSYLICPLNGLSLKTPLIQYDNSFVGWRLPRLVLREPSCLLGALPGLTHGGSQTPIRRQREVVTPPFGEVGRVTGGTKDGKVEDEGDDLGTTVQSTSQEVLRGGDETKAKSDM